jgi:hypothetical protein
MDSTRSTPPSVALTANGICHLLPVSPTPAAGEVRPVNDVPVGTVTLGHLATGQPVTLDISSLQYLDDLEGSLRVLRCRLKMHLTDLTVHPFGDERGSEGDFTVGFAEFGIPVGLA